MDEVFIGFVGFLAGFAVSWMLFRRKKSGKTPFTISYRWPNSQKFTGYMAREIEKRAAKREG